MTDGLCRFRDVSREFGNYIVTCQLVKLPTGYRGWIIRASRARYEVQRNSTMSQLRSDEKKGKQARRDHRAETRTARFVGWKLVIKIPAVALVRENVERERESETKDSKGVLCARRSTDSCVRTSAAFKPRSAFKLVAVPIRTCIYIYVRIYTHHRLCFPTRHVALTLWQLVLLFRPLPLSLPLRSIPHSFPWA